MESPTVRLPIPTEDGFRRTWSVPQCIISDEELRMAELAKRLSPHEEEDTSKYLSPLQLTKRSSPRPGVDISVSQSSAMTNGIVIRDSDHRIHEVMQTPNKSIPEVTQRLNSLCKENHKHSVYGENSDWMLAERSKSRSPPESPALTAKSPHCSPCVAVRSDGGIFNFSPDRTSLYQSEREAEQRRVRKRLFDQNMGHDLRTSRETLSQDEIDYMSSMHSPSNHQQELYLATRGIPEVELQRFLRSASVGYPHDREPVRAKRRLEVDSEESLPTSPKRIKTDLEREVGFRYLHQLQSDITVLRDKIHQPEVTKPVTCTCALMEKQFLEMAESAYRSVRRYDATPRGFEQFRRELIQTNEVIKDSMDVLKNIKGFCEHK